MWNVWDGCGMGVRCVGWVCEVCGKCRMVVGCVWDGCVRCAGMLGVWAVCVVYVVCDRYVSFMCGMCVECEWDVCGV